MAPEQPARIFAVGVNHKSGSAFLRDRLFIDEDMQPGVYARLKDQGVAQAVILSTCDRVEFQGASREPEQAVDILRGLLNEFGGGVTQTLDRSIYTYVDEAAVRHVFAVASSLDSQIIGEPQVLGQVREGHRAASAAGMVGRVARIAAQRAAQEAELPGGTHIAPAGTRCASRGKVNDLAMTPGPQVGMRLAIARFMPTCGPVSAASAPTLNDLMTWNTPRMSKRS